MNKLLKRGFTLVELLVVIAIIGILVSVAVVNYIVAQKQARDAARATIIHNIQTAFEQYYGANGMYPTINPNLIGNAFENNMVPTDPKGSASPIIWNSTTTSYCICAQLEGTNGNSTDTNCSWGTGAYTCITNQQ